MSHAAVQAILERTLVDEGFRQLLFARPDEALATYDLTPAETAALHALSMDTGEDQALALEQRESKRPFWTAGL